MTTPSRWDVRVAVAYEDRGLPLNRTNTWRTVRVRMDGTAEEPYYDRDVAVAKAIEAAPAIEGLTIIGGFVRGDSRRFWEEPEMMARIEAGRAKAKELGLVPTYDDQDEPPPSVS